MTAPTRPWHGTPHNQWTALQYFVENIDVTGGISEDESGSSYPEGDPDWLDLADTYLKACKELGVEPYIQE